jgi:hypothetical protein
MTTFDTQILLSSMSEDVSKRLTSHWGYHVEYQYLSLEIRTSCLQILQDQSISSIFEKMSKRLIAHTFEKPCLKLVDSLDIRTSEFLNWVD